MFIYTLSNHLPHKTNIEVDINLFLSFTCTCSLLKTKLISFFNVFFFLAKSNIIGPKDTASITVASNSESIVEYLETVYERSKLKFNAKAYLHWYNKYGTTNVSINVLNCRRNVQCLPPRQSGQLFCPGFIETKAFVSLLIFLFNIHAKETPMFLKFTHTGFDIQYFIPNSLIAYPVLVKIVMQYVCFV